MSLTTALWVADIAIEAAVVGLVLYRQIWRRLPMFLAFCIWALISDAANFAIRFSPAREFIATDFLKFCFVATVIDTSLQFSVLIELAGSLLRPTRSNSSRYALLAIVATVSVVGGTVWSFADGPGLSSTPPWDILLRLLQAVSVLRILFFLAFAVSSHFFSLKLTDRELQVAKGFGFYSLVGAAVSVATFQLSTASQFRDLCLEIAGGFLLPMIYWVFRFAEPVGTTRDITA
jgi:hypothetical protein